MCVSTYIQHPTSNIVSQFVSIINRSQFLALCSLTLLLVVFLASINIHKTAATSSSYSQNHKTFVKTACNSTTYPEKCYKTLSSHSAIKSDPIKLCTTALSLNVKSTKEATTVISKLLKKSQKSTTGRGSKTLLERLVLKDCLEEMKDTTIELKQAITEMKTLKGSLSVPEHIRNVLRWVSSALTDEGTCTDGFEEIEENKDTKAKVTKVDVDLARTTSNTLALITHLRY